MSQKTKSSTDARALESLLEVELPDDYRELLDTEADRVAFGRPVLGLPLTVELDSAWGATEYVRSLRPDLRDYVVLQIIGRSAYGIGVKGSKHEGTVVEFDLAPGSRRMPRKVFASLSEFLAPDEGEPEAQARHGGDALARELGLIFEKDLEKFFLGGFPKVLSPVALVVDGAPDRAPNVRWALAMMQGAPLPPPAHLMPFMTVDDRSFACVVCREENGADPEDLGAVVRWHLDAIPLRYQGAVLDVDLSAYLKATKEEMRARPKGLKKIAKLTKEFEKDHPEGKRPRFYVQRPIRVAVQNVIVGLAAMGYESSFDGLAVSCWQSCQAPHLATHEGARAMTALTLAEAFRSGGTMEVRFDSHPEGGIPASLRQFARAQELTVGERNEASISPEEARELLLAVTPMPEGLSKRIGRLVSEGILSPERACFVLLSGIWSPIELDFLLATSGRSDVILGGG